MRKFANRVSAEPREAGGNRPSGRCDLCERQTQVVMVVVRDLSSGRVRSGASLDFGNYDGSGFVPATGFTFVTWVTRCADHYIKDLYRMGRGVWSEVARDGIPTLEDYRRLRAAEASERAGDAGDSGDAGKEAPVVEPDTATRSGDGGVHRSPLEDPGAVERCAEWEVYRASGGER